MTNYVYDYFAIFAYFVIWLLVCITFVKEFRRFFIRHKIVCLLGTIGVAFITQVLLHLADFICEHIYCVLK